MPHVLVIDDDEGLLTALLSVLRLVSPPITADTAKTAEHGLRLIQYMDYDVIISDFSMPGLNGIDFLKECKNARPYTPILLLTGYGTRELEEEALKEGAYGFIQKPVDGKVFVSVLRQAIIQRQALRAGRNLLSAERERLSARLRQLDERLKKQIDDSAQ